jgi:hypothetical protein
MIIIEQKLWFINALQTNIINNLNYAVVKQRKNEKLIINY